MPIQSIKDKQRKSTIGKECRKFRKNFLNLTQEQVSEELGISQRALSVFENGLSDNMFILIYYINKGLYQYDKELFENEKIYYKRANRP